MSPPHPNWRLVGRANFRSESAPEVDPAKARAEWLALAREIERRGGTVAVLPPQLELTGLPFAAEAGHPLPARVPGGRPRFLLPRMKPVHRTAEREKWRPFVERLGFEAIELDGGIWEGQGDVATFGRHTLLFYGGRTNREGVEAARVHFDGEILPVEIEPVVHHGNMAVLPIPALRRIIVCADVVLDDSLALLEARIGRDRMHFVSSEEMRCYSTNAIAFGLSLLAPSILPERVHHLFERDGLDVTPLAMTELCEKGGGGTRCLVCHFPDAPDSLTIPADATIDAVCS